MGLFNPFKKNSSRAHPQTATKPCPTAESSRFQLRDIDPDLAATLDAQDKQLEAIQSAEKEYACGGSIDALISFWEDIWEHGGLLFNGSKWTFRLPDLYIQQARYDDALRILGKIKNPLYSDKVRSYISKISKLTKK